uniref:RING-type domain-containing protein n=1 Tax=viral metagenome TaxID=1070528 RepID=A0A6C0DPD4_9ZZZZ
MNNNYVSSNMNIRSGTPGGYPPLNTNQMPTSSPTIDEPNLLRIIDDFNMNMTQYNNNFRDYQANIRHFIDTYTYFQNYRYQYYASASNIPRNTRQPHVQPQQRTPPSNTQNATTNTRGLPIVERFNIIISDLLQDVIVRPTLTQINNATDCFPYVIDSPDSQCSITMEEFEEDEIICRIKHCGHTFKKDAIMNWFQRSVRCPICRYDIRNYVESVNVRSEEDDSVGEPTIDEEPTVYEPTVRHNIESDLTNIANDLFTNLNDNLGNNLSEFLMNYLDPSNNNMEATIEFPIIYYQSPFRNGETQR